MEDRLERSNWRSKQKGLLYPKTQFAMYGRDARSVSKEKGSAAIYTQVLRLAANHWALETMQPRRGGKIMTSKRRKSPVPSSKLKAMRGCWQLRRGSVETLLVFGASV
jgi:hypothetical protein